MKKSEIDKFTKQMLDEIDALVPQLAKIMLPIFELCWSVSDPPESVEAFRALISRSMRRLENRTVAQLMREMRK